MTDAKSAILSRIRRATGPAPISRQQDYAAIPREYDLAPELDSETRIELLSDRLRDYDTVVYRCRAGDIAASIGQAMEARQKRRLIVPPGAPKTWFPAGFEFVPDDNLGYEELDRCEGVLTGCAAAVAITGSIVLTHAPEQGRRALTLVPDYHVCVVFERQVVSTVSEAVQLIEALHPALVTTISGPSATSDIEMTRIKGVHGPRFLDVILVAEP